MFTSSLLPLSVVADAFLSFDVEICYLLTLALGLPVSVPLALPLDLMPSALTSSLRI